MESITGKSGDLAAYELEPQMITSLFDAGDRSKRQLVTYDEIPKLMVDAVLAIEDRRFFQHGGVNFLRLAEATWIDVRPAARAGRIDDHHADFRGLLPDSAKDDQAQIVEMMIAIELEQKSQQAADLRALRQPVDWASVVRSPSWALRRQPKPTSTRTCKA